MSEVPDARKAMLRSLFTCPICGKLFIRVNTAGYRRPYRPEQFDPNRHCTCTPEQKAAYKRAAPAGEEGT